MDKRKTVADQPSISVMEITATHLPLPQNPSQLHAGFFKKKSLLLSILLYPEINLRCFLSILMKHIYISKQSQVSFKIKKSLNKIKKK